MKKTMQKPCILSVKIVANSRLFTIEAVNLAFSNGVQRIYERMKPTNCESVMIVPILDQEIIFIKEYAVGSENYEIGFPKGVIESGEDEFTAANRELKEEVGFGASRLEILGRVTVAPSYFSNIMNIIVAEDLYREKLQGDEPEPPIILHWPLNNLLSLLHECDFSEARSVSALFMVREWLIQQGRLR